MERQEVDSSAIDAIGYDELTETLEIEFRISVYQYQNVPEYMYNDLMNADSIGNFFRENIKDVYPYTRIE